jgi:hypothetical protein
VIRELESQKVTLLAQVKDEEAAARRQLTELVVELDEDAAAKQDELARIQKAATERETKYHTECERLAARLERIEGQRRNVDEQRRRRMLQLQTEIDRTEGEFRAKMAEASLVAARLRAALQVASARKKQQLQDEGKRAEARGTLLKENGELRRTARRLEGELAIAKESLEGMRRDAAAIIGVGRAASLFA